MTMKFIPIQQLLHFSRAHKWYTRFQIRRQSSTLSKSLTIQTGSVTFRFLRTMGCWKDKDSAFTPQEGTSVTCSSNPIRSRPSLIRQERVCRPLHLLHPSKLEAQETTPDLTSRSKKSYSTTARYLHPNPQSHTTIPSILIAHEAVGLTGKICALVIPAGTSPSSPRSSSSFPLSCSSTTPSRSQLS